MERLAQLVIHHRRIVFGVWFALFIAGIFAAGAVPGRLGVDFSLPGQPGDTAEKHLVAAYGTSSFDTFIAVVTVPQGQDGRTTFALMQEAQPTSFAPGPEAQLRPALAKAAQAQGFSSGVTSYGLLSAGDSQSEGPSVLAETLLGAVGALLVLIFVFASFLALLPLLIAAVSILTTFLLVLLLTTFTDVSFVVQFLIALIGLGVAIDYSLLVVSRWREERAHGHGQRRGRRDRDEDGRPRGPRLRRHGRDQPGRAGRGAGAVPAQHGLRRHADPAGQRDRGPDPAARAAVLHRTEGRLPPHPPRGHGVARLVGVGPAHRPAPVDRGRRRRRPARLPDRARLRSQDRADRHRLAGQERSGLPDPADPALRRHRQPAS